MSPAKSSERRALSAATSGFVLSAAIAILFNTTLALARDGWAPLNRALKSLTPANPWIAHGIADLVVFALLGLIFTQTRLAARLHPDRLIALLAAAVVAGGLGLAAWFAAT